MEKCKKKTFKFENGVIFDENFDSGHIGIVFETSPYNFDIFLDPDPILNPKRKNSDPDASNPSHSRDNFFFLVYGIQKGARITITIKNLNCRINNMEMGILPTYHSSIKQPCDWRYLEPEQNFVQIRLVESLEKKKKLELTFTYTFLDNSERVYFSYFFPYSYYNIINFMDFLQSSSKEYLAECYYMREILATSPEGVPIDVIWLTSIEGKTKEPIPTIEHAFPTRNGNSSAVFFNNKRYIFISARVHPGETPGSFMLQGILELLTNKSDPRSLVLLKNFVFVILPCLNPDGVINGHHYHDAEGNQLNSEYGNPDPKKHPSNYAYKQLVSMILKSGRQIYSVIDLHAHKTFRGSFIYASIDPKEKEIGIYYMLLNVLHLKSMKFSTSNPAHYRNPKKPRPNKSLISSFGNDFPTIPLLFTVESNYWTNIMTRHARDKYLIREDYIKIDEERFLPSKTTIIKSGFFMTREEWKSIGHELMNSLLDIFNLTIDKNRETKKVDVWNLMKFFLQEIAKGMLDEDGKPDREIEKTVKKAIDSEINILRNKYFGWPIPGPRFLRKRPDTQRKIAMSIKNYQCKNVNKQNIILIKCRAFLIYFFWKEFNFQSRTY